MIKYPISFSVDHETYSASFILISGSSPLQIEIADLEPADFKPILPYIFTVNKQKGKLDWTISNTADVDFGVPISSAILNKALELGINVFK